MNDERLKKAHTYRLRGQTTPLDNVLYFPNNIDVRICPKNGMSSLKWALLECHGEVSTDRGRDLGTKADRVKSILEHGYQNDLPFRQNSVRIAVSRDPIKRFLSAAEYIQAEYERVKDTTDVYEIAKLSDVQKLPDDLDELIRKIREEEIVNSHFFPQVYFLGNRSQYNAIWPMRDFTKLLGFLKARSGTNTDLTTIRENKSERKHYPSPKDLTELQVARIMKIYREDYNYGWTED